MNKKDKTETIGLISEALNEVMIPALEDMEERLAAKLDMKADKEDVGRVERKLDAMTDRLDRHGKAIEELQTAVA